MKYKILVADDEKRMRILISDFLVDAGYEIIEACDGAEAIEIFMENKDISLVILDVMMPYYNGWEICEEIRRSSKIPIIMLTAKAAEKDELQGFNKGADEYIKKPFSPSVLVARVNALLVRTYNKTSVIEKGTLSIDLDKHSVKNEDVQIELSLTEYKLLVYLLENENVVVGRDTLLNNVWGYDYEGTDRTVDTHINRLRDKLNQDVSYIKTVRGYGYKFEVPK
ncbi:response regulator transcription factor [Clostridia bacterium]|nr:response regulator transcription factor [Clostridia bacterium]